MENKAQVNMTTFDLDNYRASCNKISQLIRKGRGGIYLGGYDVLGSDIFGHQYIVDSRHASSLKLLYAPPPIEASILGLLINIIRRGMVCVDIGSGCGYYSIILASIAGKHGKVYSFETIPECFNMLKKNIEMNDMETIVPINCLALDDVKKKKLVYFGGNYQFFFLNAEDQKAKEIEVESIILDRYFDEREHCIDFVKINLEEYLPSIFKGLSDQIKVNQEIKILCAFNKEKIKESGEIVDDFFENLTNHKFEMFLLPNLEPIDESELLSYTSTKIILLSKRES